MDNEILDSNLSGDQFTVSSEIQNYLKETAKWAYFLAILGFIGLAFMIMAGVFMMTSLGSLASQYPSEVGATGLMGGGFIGGLYIVIALLYYFPSIYLYRFAKNMKLASRTGDQTAYTDGFKNLKSFFKFIGVLTAAFLILYFVIIIGAMLFGLGGGF